MIENDVARIVADRYGIHATPHPLPGEIDRILRLETTDGPGYAARLSPPGTDPARFGFEAEILHRLGGLDGVRVPNPVPTRDGRDRVDLPDAWILRLFTWVPGTSFAAAGRPEAAARSIGRTAGHVARALSGFSHPVADRSLPWDLRRATDVIAQHGSAVTDPQRERTLGRVAAGLTGIPFIDLPSQVIHNDLNDENVLIAGTAVVGVIDIGDSIESVRIGEAAIAATYAMLDQDDPATIGCEVVRGFAEIVAVTAQEAAVIFDLVLARLATSVVLSAHRGPENPHHTVSEDVAWDLLERFVAADTGAVAAELAAAAGLSHPIRNARLEALAARRRVLGPSLSLSYDEPLSIVRGAGVSLYDQRGRRYLDTVNNVAHVGHGHPAVVRAANDQMAVLNTNTRYLHNEVLRYASRLAGTLPEPLNVVFVVNSGSEANELAIRLVRTATEAFDIACLDHGYHGNTSTLIDVSPYKFDGPGGRGRPSFVAVLPAPDPYRAHAFCGVLAANHYREAADSILERHPEPIAGLIAESLPGCAGQIMPEPGVLAAAYSAVRDRGGLVIADEVQTGFGRAGSTFWAFALHGVVPDVVTMGKPIGNGHPLGAVVTTRAIADALDMEYFNTFGGNPVAAAVGNAVLDVIANERLQQNAARMGNLLQTQLTALAQRDERIGDVRGAGLFMGVELVDDAASLRPATALTAHVVESAKADGVLLSSDGPDRNVIKIKPPLVFSSSDCARLVGAIERGLASATRDTDGG